MRSFACLLLFAPALALAQFGGVAPPPPSRVDVDILTAPRLEATVSTDPGSTIGVSGPSGARLEVEVDGTVSLSTASLNALNGRTCTPLRQSHSVADTTVRAFPTTPGLGRTTFSLTSHGTTGFLSCSAGPLSGFTAPVCTAPSAGTLVEGLLVYPGANITMELSENWYMRCLHCGAGVSTSLSVMELSCF